jgi:hypothetical protein
MDSCQTPASEFVVALVRPYIVLLGMLFDFIIVIVNFVAVLARLVDEFLEFIPEPAEQELVREFHFSNPTSAETREWCLFFAFLSVPLSYLLFRLYFYSLGPNGQEEVERRVSALSTDRLDVFYFWRERHRDGGVYPRRRAAAAA